MVDKADGVRRLVELAVGPDECEAVVEGEKPRKRAFELVVRRNGPSRRNDMHGQDVLRSADNRSRDAMADSVGVERIGRHLHGANGNRQVVDAAQPGISGRRRGHRHIPFSFG